MTCRAHRQEMVGGPRIAPTPVDLYCERSAFHDGAHCCRLPKECLDDAGKLFEWIDTAVVPATHKVTVRVYHDYYGCETGCCGHRLEITLPDGTEREVFEFDHPGGDEAKAWAREFAEDIIRRRWPACLPTIDWDTLNFEDVSDSC